jgi:hypothetical protein
MRPVKHERLVPQSGQLHKPHALRDAERLDPPSIDLPGPPAATARLRVDLGIGGHSHQTAHELGLPSVQITAAG